MKEKKRQRVDHDALADRRSKSLAEELKRQQCLLTSIYNSQIDYQNNPTKNNYRKMVAAMGRLTSPMKELKGQAHVAP